MQKGIKEFEAEKEKLREVKWKELDTALAQLKEKYTPHPFDKLD